MREFVPSSVACIAFVPHRKPVMTRIIDDRHNAASDEEMIRLRVWQWRKGDVRACILPLDAVLDQNSMRKISDPIEEAFLDALTICEVDDIGTLWIDDPMGIFPPADRPIREM